MCQCRALLGLRQGTIRLATAGGWCASCTAACDLEVGGKGAVPTVARGHHELDIVADLV